MLINEVKSCFCKIVMKKYFSIFCILFLSSCSSIQDRPSIPSTVLTQEKMAKLLVDVHLLEASLNINTYSKDQIILNTIHPDSDVLKKNGVTKKQYEESFEFYSRNPLLFAEVYQFVLNDLSKMQAEVMNQK